jgi:hypothetical protein
MLSTNGNGFWHTEGTHYLSLKGRIDNNEWEIRSNRQGDRKDISYHVFHTIRAGTACLHSVHV